MRPALALALSLAAALTALGCERRSERASFVITPEAGGSVRAGGLTLEIPPGAVDAPIVIHVERMGATTPPGAVALTARYAIEPRELRLSRPALLALDATDPLPGAAIHCERAGMLATEIEETRVLALLSSLDACMAVEQPADAGVIPGDAR